jgi:hypothetical protein
MRIEFADGERAIYARSLGLPDDAPDTDIITRVGEACKAANVPENEHLKWLTPAERKGLTAEIERRKRNAGL